MMKIKKDKARKFWVSHYFASVIEENENYTTVLVPKKIALLSKHSSMELFFFGFLKSRVFIKEPAKLERLRSETLLVITEIIWNFQKVIDIFLERINCSRRSGRVAIWLTSFFIRKKTILSIRFTKR